ncbi:prephenate dehydratase domain-containing protein [Methanoregula sp. PtaB.Bin085]|uniref:prephenate dehydratase n=1 Tax=Methanoregula sp. PtaB.Bin085 TaxID=1811680 RepID=UPI0009D45CC3|nr:prephenate dehydratase domain-containing protein [Methanoregula sp. PtaB.Bin085]OPX63461.1 MAG: Prephenate dehydratase [Methanoregula sp. PtaB.Bin085]
MTTITLGPEGTFSHEVTLKLKCRELVFAPTIHAIMAAVAKGDGDGVVPMENSEAGGVGETLDGLSKYPLYITGEMYLPIHHNLASTVPLKEIRVIFAHPQTHEQCSDKIEAWGIPVIHTSSNAASAQEAKRVPNAGAILSEAAANLYRLPIIVPAVQNNPDNITRFVRISRTPSHDPRLEKCSVLIDPHRDRPGLLSDLLGAFAKRKINLTRIESRPSKRKMGEYVFFLDYAWTPDAPEVLKELQEITTVKELGCYRRIAVNP